MDGTDIANARLVTQQVAIAETENIKKLVSYMGAIQAQDFGMAKWAIALRLHNTTEKQIETAFNKGQILRAHVLRPTWHFIPATDIYWLQAISADKIIGLMKTMDKQLELNEKIFNKSHKIIENCLAEGKHLTREVIGERLLQARIRSNENRLSHLLIRAELEGIACSGQLQGNKQTYALLSDRVPNNKVLHKEEALALLAQKYFTSRGPATLQDFTWWSGLSVTDARTGLEAVKSKLVAEKIQDKEYWIAQSFSFQAPRKKSVHLLPAFDEFIISYKDRTAALAAAHHKKVLTVNGIFYPAIIVDGQVTGTWKRSFKQDSVLIETSFFKPHSKAVKNLIEKKAKLFAQYTGSTIMQIHYA